MPLKTVEAPIETYGRKITVPEFQRPVNIIVSTSHLELAEVRQRKFDEDLGIRREGGEIISYNPVFDRVNVELAKTDEQLQAVKSDMDKELRTNLRERYRTAKSIVKYILDDHGRVFSEDDHDEPVDVKFQRGVLHRIRQGSPEAEREQQTVLAGVMAKGRLAHPQTTLGSKVIVISPPGTVENTAYKDNFVNIYELALDSQTNKKIIWMTCFASSCSNKDYEEVITRLKPNCSDCAGSFFDVWCLSNPIFIDSRLDAREAYEIFSQEFKPQEGVTKEDDFQEILRRTFSVRQNYIDIISGKVFEPLEIVEAFNAVLNKADAIRKEIIYRGRKIVGGILNFASKSVDVFKNIKEEVKWWGRQAVEKVMGGCGMSGGFSIGGRGALRSVLGVGRSIAGILGIGGIEHKWFVCPECGYRADGLVGDSCPKSKGGCGLTKEEYIQSGGRVC